jgi:ketosteroid isomerase-like protein
MVNFRSDEPPMTIEDTVDRFLDAFNRHDETAVVSFMTEDCVFEGAAGPEVHGARFLGREAAAEAFRKVWETFPDARWDVRRVVLAGEDGFAEWVFSGRRSDGMRIEAEGCDLLTFRNGLIRVKKAFRKDRPLLPA